MKTFMYFQNLPSKRRFTFFLSFLLLTTVTLFLNGCKKDFNLEGDYTNTLPRNPITATDASAWFNTQFGETRSIVPKRASFTGDNNTNSNDYYFEEQLDITPLWSNAKISTYLKIAPILYVPVKAIPSLDAKSFNYTLVFFRDSVGLLDARLQVYMASPNYKTLTNEL